MSSIDQVKLPCYCAVMTSRLGTIDLPAQGISSINWSSNSTHEGFMAGKKAISVSQFVEHFRRAWLGTQEKFHSGRSLDRNDFNQLPRRLGK
jgi:hypothetical protein